MRESDERAGAKERAAFHISIQYYTDADGHVVWQTHADHEESGAHAVWPGAPGEALLRWLIEVAELPAEVVRPQPAPTEAPAPVAAEVPAPEPEEGEPGDDFTQIIGIGSATARRLQQAGIRTYAQLAARTPEELSAIVHISADRIARRGWIARARALARLASLPPNAGVEAPPPDTRAAGSDLGTALIVELHFDESGDLIEQLLLREGDAPTTVALPGERYIARFFVEPPAAMVGQATGELSLAYAGGAAPTVAELALDDLELDELPAAAPGAPPRLRARTTIRRVGLEADMLARAHPDYVAYVLAYALDTGETSVLQSIAGRFNSQTPEEPLEIAFPVPEVGRYQTALVLLCAGFTMVYAATGPRLRVNP